MRRGYFTPPVLIILAIIIFAVAILIAINTDLVKRIKKEPSSTPISSSSPISDGGREPSGSAETVKCLTKIDQGMSVTKIFTNETFNFKIEYPQNWIVSSQNCELKMINKEPTIAKNSDPRQNYPVGYKSISIFISDPLKNEGESADNWYKKFGTVSNTDYDIKTLNFSNINGYEVKKVKALNDWSEGILIMKRDNYIYWFVINPYEKDTEINQILSTFQFLN